MTLGTPATTRCGISVANYNHNTEEAHPASSLGRTRDGRDKPEVAAPGTNILSAHALGGRPDGKGGNYPVRIAMTGTSMSAPARRWHHCAVAGGQAHAHCRANPQSTDRFGESATGVATHDTAWGYGRVDAEAAWRILG